jgi:ADP-ribosylglycohydrolase
MAGAGGAAGAVAARERLEGAVWGQLVGDAAALGTHWIYDLAALRARYPDVRGFEAPLAGHYHHPKAPGAQTHYGDGALVMLASVATSGRFDRDDFGRRFVARFGPGYRGYLDHATRGTLVNVAAGRGFDRSGADDDQLATASRLAPVVVWHRDDPRLFHVVDEATRVAQEHPTAVGVNRANAVILRALCGGAGVAAALDAALADADVPADAKALLDKGRARAREDTVAATLALGQSCPLPRSFPGAVQALLRHGGSYADAILATIRAGGDNAGRAAMLGAWLGAHLGVHAIPAAWRERLAARADIEAALARLST